MSIPCPVFLIAVFYLHINYRESLISPLHCVFTQTPNGAQSSFYILVSMLR